MNHMFWSGEQNLTILSLQENIGIKNENKPQETSPYLHIRK